MCGKDFNEVVSRYGCPLDLHSDQGRNYESDIFKEMCDLLEIRKTRTSARNLKANGLCERFNRTIIRMIRAYLRGEQTDWDLNLGCLGAAYWSTPQASTGMTPNLLMFGRDVRLPAEVMFGSLTQNGEDITSYGDYVDELKSKMQHAHYVCRKHLEDAATRQITMYDVKRQQNNYSPGDSVWCLNESRKEGICPKLQLAYDGPFVVAKKFSEQNSKGRKWAEDISTPSR